MKSKTKLPQRTKNITIHEYVNNQMELVDLDYKLEAAQKQKNKVANIDLFFYLQSKVSSGRFRKWTTTLPLPKNLIAPEYLITTDPSYVNVSDKIQITFLDCYKDQIEGSIMKIRDGELTATFDLDWMEESARHKCSVAFLPNDIVYKRKMNALKHLKNLNQDLQNMLCRIYPKKQIIPDIKLYLPSGYDFNDSQKKAIRMAVSNPFSLIQGPPGTGKTHTIGAIAIQALHQNPNKKVLICGTTNVSISSLLEIVGDMVQDAGFKVCWPAASARDFVSEANLSKEQKLMTLYLSRHLNTPKSRRFNELCKNIGKNKNTNENEREKRKLREELEVEVIRQSNVIFSTLDSCGKRSIGMNVGDVSTLVVDEATLSVETSMVIPLSQYPDRLVLVGDHKQLGPQASYDELKEKGYYKSMFERIIKEKSCLKNSVMLTTQYRMHPDISRIPNHLYYDDELIDGVKNEDREIEQNFVDKYKIKEHLNFINFESREEKNGTSYINYEEKDLVFNFVNALINSGIDQTQIGVISAYGSQTSLISEKLRNSNIYVKISTIDSFQGSQKDYIIICTTRNGKNLGFLNDQRRMNVAVTRARRLVVIFGNAKTLMISEGWKTIIDYAKKKNSYFEKLPCEFEELPAEIAKQNPSSEVKIERRNTKQLTISKKAGNVVKIMISEFKEDENNAGYKLREIKSEISDSEVRVLWPDEKDDIIYLKEWVQKRINILNKKKHVTLVYDAKDVCMQFGDIFDDNIDYYNWESDNQNFPEIKTNESIIVSLYKHSDDYGFDKSLVTIMKPLLENPKITLISFDFCYDFDKLYDFGINIQTNKIIDVQLMYLPDDTDIYDDIFCSKGWKSIRDLICQVNEDNDNSNMIERAKRNIKNNKIEKFPYDENAFLINQYEHKPISQFTKIFLEYSAKDIFLTAILAVDVLSKGELDDVKERTDEKIEIYQKYRKQYGCANEVRLAYYARESFSSVISVEFSKDNETYQILSYYKKFKAFVSLLDKHPNIITNLIPSFSDQDDAKIKQRYKDIVEIMTNKEYEHLGNIKYKAILSFAPGNKTIPSFIFVPKEKSEPIQKNNKPQNDQTSNQQNEDKPSGTSNEKKPKKLVHKRKRSIKKTDSCKTSTTESSQQEEKKIIKSNKPALSNDIKTSNSNNTTTKAQQEKINRDLDLSNLSNKSESNSKELEARTQQVKNKPPSTKDKSSLTKTTPKKSKLNEKQMNIKQQSTTKEANAQQEFLDKVKDSINSALSSNTKSTSSNNKATVSEQQKQISDKRQIKDDSAKSKQIIKKNTESLKKSNSIVIMRYLRSCIYDKKKQDCSLTKAILEDKSKQKGTLSKLHKFFFKSTDLQIISYYIESKNDFIVKYLDEDMPIQSLPTNFNVQIRPHRGLPYRVCTLINPLTLNKLDINKDCISFAIKLDIRIRNIKSIIESILKYIGNDLENNTKSIKNTTPKIYTFENKKFKEIKSYEFIEKNEFKPIFVIWEISQVYDIVVDIFQKHVINKNI